LDPLQLSDYIDRNVVDRFSSLDGVARVFIGGEARRRCGSGCSRSGSPPSG
jgi:multidrug efflux pump subunit AcrB